MRAISTRTGIPFVLHGASGLPDAELVAAVDAGVAKVNINRPGIVNALPGA